MFIFLALLLKELAVDEKKTLNIKEFNMNLYAIQYSIGYCQLQFKNNKMDHIFHTKAVS